MKDQEVLDQIALWINAKWPTGIAFIQRTDNTLIIDWVDDSSDEITVDILHTAPGRRA